MFAQQEMNNSPHKALPIFLPVTREEEKSNAVIGGADRDEVQLYVLLELF